MMMYTYTGTTTSCEHVLLDKYTAASWCYTPVEHRLSVTFSQLIYRLEYCIALDVHLAAHRWQ
jgi:hypothetical protein